MLIEDGKGTGRKCAVNSNNELVVHAVTNSFLQQESDEFGNAYVWSSGLVTGASLSASSTVLALKNTAVGKLHIDRIVICSNGADEYIVQLPSNNFTPAGDTEITGININTDSNNTADATAYTDESGNTQGDILEYVFAGATSRTVVDMRGIFLGKNKSIAVDAVGGDSNCSVSIYGHYIDVTA